MLLLLMLSAFKEVNEVISDGKLERLLLEILISCKELIPFNAEKLEIVLLLKFKFLR